MPDPLLELQQKIDAADHAYYTHGTSPIEDAIYDRWKDELSKLAPKDARLARIGAQIQDTMLQKTQLEIPMGSQFKATNEEEYRAWVQQFPPNTVYHASYKMDGCSVSFKYLDGLLVQAVSRGDGNIGENITTNATMFKNLPKIAKYAGKHFSGYMRGEVLLLLEDWRKVELDLLKNPRNTAAGISRRKNGEDSQMLSVYAFRLFDLDGNPIGKTESAQTSILEQMGFTPAPSMVGTGQEVWEWFLKTATLRPNLAYCIDGIVVKINSISAQLDQGTTNNRPKGQVAVKFEAEEAETYLRRINLSVGYTGAIVPTAEFDTVNLGGAQVNNASLDNWDTIRSLNINIGDKIRVLKAGDIIPRVGEVVEKITEGSFPEPLSCPVCDGPIARRSTVAGDDTATVYCESDDCPAKRFGRIKRFLTALNILGIGDSILEGLISQLDVQDAADLFTLHKQVEVMAELKSNGKVKLGLKRATKILEELDQKRQLTLPQFLGALGIQGLGERRVELILEAGSYMEDIQHWFDGTMLKQANELGIPNLAESLQQRLIQMKPVADRLLAAGVTIQKTAPKPIVQPWQYRICITGSLSQPKSHFKSLIEQAGHIWEEDYNSNVTHLIAADPQGDSGKLKKARKNGIPVLAEEGLIALLKNTTNINA